MSTSELRQLRDDLRALHEFVEGIRPHVERVTGKSRIDRFAPRRVRADSNVLSLDRFRSSPTPLST
jgi:hypothetical protein